MRPELRPYVETVWNYHQLGHDLRNSDAILVLCSHDRVVAEHAAQLWLDGWAPLLIVSGGLGAITRRFWSEPEADQFARIALAMGVPRERILVENRSTNTGENVLFTRGMVESMGLDLRSVLLVQKPYMERRAWATFRKVWPQMELAVTSPRLPLDAYLARYDGNPLTEDDAIAIMVGDLQRIRVYAAKGWQIPQEIPDDVWRAYEALVEAGYDRYLVAG